MILTTLNATVLQHPRNLQMPTTKVTITTITADFEGELSAGSGAAFAEELASALGAKLSDASPVSKPKVSNSDWTAGARSERRSPSPQDEQGVGPKTMVGMRLTDEAKARFNDLCYLHRGETVSDVLVRLMDAYEFGRR